MKSKALGWVIDYRPAKQKRKLERKFLIPKGVGPAFVDHHGIFQTYYDKVGDVIKPKTTETLFWTGKSYKSGLAKLVRCPLGINEMRKVLSSY